MQERRRSPRVDATTEIMGRVKATLPVRLIDLSVLGAQLESSTGLPPAGEVDLWLPTPHGELQLRAGVRRSRALAGPKGLVFRAGVEFVDLTDTQSEWLAAAVAAMRGEIPARLMDPVQRMPDRRLGAVDPLEELDRLSSRAG
jgi:hypothetical protein